LLLRHHPEAQQFIGAIKARPVQAVWVDLLEARRLLFTDIQMPGSMNGLKLAHAVHERWPLIKIILVSGQVTPTEGETPTNSRFFGKPLEVEQMVAELQSMIGKGSLKIVPTEIVVPANGGPTVKLSAEGNTVQEHLTAENDTLRLLLEQAGIDAQVLLAQAGIDAKEREAADKLQKLILEELHHRIKNTLATVRAITSQSLRTAISLEHAASHRQPPGGIGSCSRFTYEGKMGQREFRSNNPQRDRALR